MIYWGLCQWLFRITIYCSLTCEVLRQVLLDVQSVLLTLSNCLAGEEKCADRSEQGRHRAVMWRAMEPQEWHRPNAA